MYGIQSVFQRMHRLPHRLLVVIGLTTMGMGVLTMLSLREVVHLFTFSPNLLHLCLHSSTLLRTSRSEPWVVIIQGILYLVTSMVIRCWTCLLWRIWDHWCLGHGMFLISLQIIRLEQMLPRTMM